MDGAYDNAQTLVQVQLKIQTCLIKGDPVSQLKLPTEYDELKPNMNH